MKIYSKGRSEIIEQAGRKSFHMGFDLDIESFGITMEADLSLPTKSNRKISMMTSFNEELYNSASEFLGKVKLYDGDMREFNDDMLVTLVTKMLHNTIQKLNEKDEPLWNVFVKTPKARAKELELVKEEYLGKSNVVKKAVVVEETNDEYFEEEVVEEKVINEVVSKPKQKRVVTTDFKKLKSSKPVREPKEDPFYDVKKVF